VTIKSRTGPRESTNAGLIEIGIQYRSLESLVLDSRNPRQHPQAQVNQIADSIREFGFLMPVVIDDLGHVVIGHGRLLAAKKLGMPQVPVIENPAPVQSAAEGASNRG
jgi:ParB-like chromosome segregation protein Spo0J